MGLKYSQKRDVSRVSEFPCFPNTSALNIALDALSHAVSTVGRPSEAIATWRIGTSLCVAASAILASGLAAVIGLSLALLFALGAPWRGPITVSGHPIDAVVHDLDTGYFHP